MSEITEIQRNFFFFFLDLGLDKVLMLFKKCSLEHVPRNPFRDMAKSDLVQLHETVGLRRSLASPCCHSNSSVRHRAETEIDRQLCLPIG